MRRGFVAALGLAIMVIAIGGVATSAAGKTKKLDKGLLEPSWFGSEIEFRITDDIDYIWVKPGFTVKGKKLHIDAWSDPHFLDDDRDAKDHAKASELTELMPSRLRGALSATLAGLAETSKEEGELVVTGRIVDCNAGSKAAKFLVGFGAGAASVTYDIKFTDRESGETVAAIHHRVISGTSMSEIDDKVAKWLEKFGEALRDDLAVASKGKVARK